MMPNPIGKIPREAMLKRDNRRMLFQLGIAALGAMQAMMFAVALYFGNIQVSASTIGNFTLGIAVC